MKRAGIFIAAGLALTACAPQGGPGQQARGTASTPSAPAPQPQPKQQGYNLNGGSMVVVTEPSPAARRTTAALDLVESKTLLDVARQASIRVAKADAGSSSVINAVALPTTDAAIRIEQVLLGRLGNVFSLAVKVNQVGNPSRAFPFNSAGAQELAGKLKAAGLKGYALDARTEFMDVETSGGTINDPVERFSLNGQVQARLIDLSDGRVIRQAVCTDNQQMGTLRDIFVAEGRPVPQSAALAAVTAPAPAPASEQPVAQSDGPRPASDTSAAALALIQKTDQAEKSQKLVEASTPTAPVVEPAAIASQVPSASVEQTEVAAAKPEPVLPAPTPTAQPSETEAETETVAREAVAAVTAPAEPVRAAAVATPEPASATTPVATPAASTPEPSAQDRVQTALQQAAPTRSEVAAQQAAEKFERERPKEVPIRRSGAFSGVVQSAIEETPDTRLVRRQRTVNVQGAGVRQKARLASASLLAAQATAPIALPGPGASGRVSDGAAERFIRKCAEDLWQKIVPE